MHLQRDRATGQGHTAGKWHPGDLNLHLSGLFPPEVHGPPFPDLSVLYKDSCGLKTGGRLGLISLSVRLSTHPLTQL